MAEIKYIIRNPAVAFCRFRKLGQVHTRKAETQHIYSIEFVRACTETLFFTIPALPTRLITIGITGYAKLKFKIIFLRSALLEMIHHHTGVVHVPLWISLITLDIILHRPRYLALFFLNQDHLVLHYGLLICQSEYIRRLKHGSEGTEFRLWKVR